MFCKLAGVRPFVGFSSCFVFYLAIALASVAHADESARAGVSQSSDSAASAAEASASAASTSADPTEQARLLAQMYAEMDKRDREDTLDKQERAQYLMSLCEKKNRRKIKEIVVKIFSEQLGLDMRKFAPDLRFDSKAIGADQLDQDELIMALEDEFSVEVPDVEAAKLWTVTASTQYVTRQLCHAHSAK